MPRPLLQAGVGQLETMFGTCRGNLRVLRQLEAELQYRQVPRAIALLEKVQAAIAASGKTREEPTSQPPIRPPLPATAPPQQPGLWGQVPAQAPRSATPPQSPTVSATPSPPTPSAMPSIKSMGSQTSTKSVTLPTPTMALEDAYKLLRATAGSSWQSIEQTRRQLVQQAHPSQLKSLGSDKYARCLSEARRVNSAYAVLSMQRGLGG